MLLYKNRSKARWDLFGEVNSALSGDTPGEVEALAFKLTDSPKDGPAAKKGCMQKKGGKHVTLTLDHTGFGSKDASVFSFTYV